MSRNVCTFRRTELRRAVRALAEAGAAVRTVTISKVGHIELHLAAVKPETKPVRSVVKRQPSRSAAQAAR